MQQFTFQRILSRIALAAVLGSLTVVAAAEAQSFHFDISNQSLSQALRHYGQVSGEEIIFTEDLVADVPATSLQGEYTAEVALKRLLQGTGLVAERSPSGALMIRRIKSPQVSASKPDVFGLTSQDLRLAQTDKPSPSQGEGQGEDEKQDESDGKDSDQDTGSQSGIPEILVTGSKLRTLNMDIKRTEDDIQPYVVFDRAAIERSGAINLDAFFKSQLTAAVNASSPNQTVGPMGNTSAIDLRGLGTDETLILVDGHRVASLSIDGAAGQPDLNGIPLSAVERIEVLPTTASGIYGGGATGGVINVVLRRDYSGLEMKLGYGNTFGSDARTRRVDISSGFNLESGRTNILFTASYSDENPLLASERDFAQRGRQKILANNPDFYYLNPQPPFGSTPNFRTVTGENLTLDSGESLNYSFGHIPLGYAGTSSDGGAALIGAVGQYNFEPANTAQTGGAYRGLLSHPTVKSAMITLRRDFSSDILGYVEMNVTSNDSAFAYNPVTSRFVIRGDAPNNPFRQSIRVAVPVATADSEIDVEAQGERAVAGVIVRISDRWQAATDFTWNRSKFAYSFPRALTPDSTGQIASGSLDVLRDVNLLPVSVSFTESPVAAVSPTDVILRDTSLRAAGSVPLGLPAGDVALSILLERREESFNSGISTAFGIDRLIPKRKQSVNSAYLEARVPLVSAQNKIPFAREVELQVAARRDEYKLATSNDIFLNNPEPIIAATSRRSSTDPTFGLRYQPIEDLSFRASLGTGYLPPSVRDIVPGITYAYVANFLTDPLRNNEPLGLVTFTIGGNPNLAPEQSRSFSSGFVYKPEWLNTLRFSADWTKINKTDNIGYLDGEAQSGLNQYVSSLPNRVTRGAPSDGFDVGPITAIDQSAVNIAKLETEALDFALDYNVSTINGDFHLAVDATRILSLDTLVSPAAQVISSAGVGGGSLKWKIHSSVVWSRADWTIGWNARFFDSYYLNADRSMSLNQGAAIVPSQIYHDVVGNYRFNSPRAGMLGDAEIQFGITNIFNKRPPVDTTNGEFLYSTWGDPRLASYFVAFRKGFEGK